MGAVTSMFKSAYRRFNELLDAMIPYGDLMVRLYLARVFVISAYAKVIAWDQTVYLYTTQYHEPLLPPILLAWLSSIIEFTMPILMLLGLGGRVPACILFVFNLLAAFTFPNMQSSGNYMDVQDHLYWALLILMLMLHGNGRIALDRLITQKKG